MRHILKEDTNGTKSLGASASAEADTDTNTDAGTTKYLRTRQSKKDETTKSKPVPIGDDFQAEIPKIAFTRSKHAEHIQVKSKLVFAPDACGDEKNVKRFLTRVEVKELKHKGFGCAPTALERYLHSLMAKDGDVQLALEDETARNLNSSSDSSPNSSEIDTVSDYGKPWTKTEKQKLALLVAEFGYDYNMLVSIMRRFCKRHVDIPEMIRLCNENRDANQDISYLFDLKSSKDKTNEGSMSPDRLVASFRELAKNACDGFPADRRIVAAMKMYKTQSRAESMANRSALLDADKSRWLKARGKRFNSERSAQPSKNAPPSKNKHPRLA